MILAQQKRRVRKLAAAAASRAGEAEEARHAIREWRRQVFGSPDVLAWMFAAGTWWAAGTRKRVDGSRLRRIAIAATNAWWLVSRIVRQGPALSSAAKGAAAAPRGGHPGA